MDKNLHNYLSSIPPTFESKIECGWRPFIGILQEGMYSNSIEIVMIKDASNNKRDDRIVIKKDMSYNEFQVTYSEKSTGTSFTQKLTGLYREKVMQYVYMLLKNQSLDEDGYSSFQINMIAMPGVFVTADKLKDLYYRDHFYEMIGSGLDLMDNCETVDNSGGMGRSESMGRSQAMGVHEFFDEV